MKLKKGDVFRIKTKLGYGFLQYIETDDLGIEYVRVLEPISENGILSRQEVECLERWCIGFPLKAAERRKIVEKVGNFDIPQSFINYEHVRAEHNIRGEKIGWHIVNKASLKRELKQNLDAHDRKLSPHGIMNDTLIISMLEENWRLQDWV
jgi:hypothetical protein